MYYMTQIQKFKDDTPTAIATFEYTGNTPDEALNNAMIAYHSVLASSRSDSNIASIIAFITNEHGNQEIKEYWTAPIS